MKKAVLLVIISTIFSLQLICQSKIGFFMAVSDSSDTATINLTQDLYFQKLSLLPNVVVSDLRETKFSSANLSEYPDLDFVFYPEIQENGTGWKCIFHAKKISSNQNYTSEKTYDSYYMILMDAKNEITKFIEKLNSPVNESSLAENFSSGVSSSIESFVSIESLSGTWTGEEFIDKIVILRGGRGFVIYQNGASMNISLKIENGKLIATQISKSNASYFPEISREKALELAPTANPIEWTLNIKNSSELEGTKYTLAENDKNSPEFSNIPVKWKKL